ncbi:hypothetical protein TNCV_5129671 [Trichonephila clavipes]|nr:hypothetical protein TNCV_5129671 [Trichonephila clavipes]
MYPSGCIKDARLISGHQMQECHVFSPRCLQTGYIHHDVASRSGTEVLRRLGTTPVSSFVVGRTSFATRAVSKEAAIMVPIFTVSAVSNVFSLSSCK